MEVAFLSIIGGGILAMLFVGGMWLFGIGRTAGEAMDNMIQQAREDGHLPK